MRNRDEGIEVREFIMNVSRWSIEESVLEEGWEDRVYNRERMNRSDGSDVGVLQVEHKSSSETSVFRTHEIKFMIHKYYVLAGRGVLPSKKKSGERNSVPPY